MAKKEWGEIHGLWFFWVYICQNLWASFPASSLGVYILLLNIVEDDLPTTTIDKYAFFHVLYNCDHEYPLIIVLIFFAILEGQYLGTHYSSLILLRTFFVALVSSFPTHPVRTEDGWCVTRNWPPKWPLVSLKNSYISANYVSILMK